MYSKIILNIVLIISLVVIQLSFISGLPANLNNLNLILIILIFILSLINLDTAMWWAVGAGFLLDIFSFTPFAVYLVCLFLTIVIANFLLVNFFTDRSLYSFLALVGLTTVIYEFFVNVVFLFPRLIYGGGINISLNYGFWIEKISRLGFNLLVTLLLFYSVHYISNRLRPVFLMRR